MRCWEVLGLVGCLGSVAPEAVQGQASGRKAINPPSLPPLVRPELMIEVAVEAVIPAGGR